MECGSEASAHAEASASALQTCPRAAPLSHAVGEGLGVRAKQGAPPCVPTPLLVRVHRFGTESLRQGRFSPRGRERAGAPCCPHPPAPSPARRERGNARLPSPTLWARGVGAHGGAPCSAFPLSHAVGAGCRGARRCALQRVPHPPPAREGDKGGEGKKARLPVHACAGKNSPCFKDFVPNRCTLIPITEPEFIIAPLLQVPPASRGEPKGLGSPCSQGEP